MWVLGSRPGVASQVMLFSEDMEASFSIVLFGMYVCMYMVKSE